MVVTFTKAGAGSNKTGAIDVQLIAYHVEGGITVLKPMLDKITLTYPVPSEQHQAIIDKLKSLAEVKGPYSKLILGSGHKFGRGYKLSVALSVPPASKRVVIQVAPKNPAHRFMRLEFNPHKLGAEGMVFLKEQLGIILLNQHSWADIAASGRVTRMDVAVDIVNLPIDQMVIASDKQGKSHCYYSATGMLETAYLEITKDNESAKTKLYNKGEHLEAQKREQKYGDKPHTRIEVRIDGTKFPVAKLWKLKNPLAHLFVTYPAPSVLPPEAPHHWRFFLDGLRVRGREAALSLLPTDTLKGEYEVALDACAKIIWRPDTLWTYWPTVLQGYGLLP